jgi:hypothetical protein
MLFFIFNGKLAGFVIIKAKQEVLCLFKSVTRIYTWKMTKDELSASSASSHFMSQAV